MKSMNIKLDDHIHETFSTAAKIITQSGISVPIPQLAETIINAELSGMDAKKLARKFIKSLTNRLSEVEEEPNCGEEKETAYEV